MIARLRDTYASLAGAAAWLQPLALLAVRLVAARVFWNSGLGKVETFRLLGIRIPTFDFQQSTFYLFKHEFFPGLPKGVTDVLAVMAGLGELTLPLLVAFGLLARLGALGLLAMTAVIQIFVFPGEWWSVHAWWAVTLLTILAFGPGAISIDRLTGLEPKPA
ncbi:DoxX family membrane protein [Marinicauda algicola]|uniref:DoxX family membrane protein n=1 Tax=Marinicauda algicola TaxID=2029849 RepID=A0A4S2H109_9PROT|nr:DoxX family membrane protein [Marinicauda algicola]TGY89195.1 DoxX family membrane protein [Marinicauda algicola]